VKILWSHVALSLNDPSTIVRTCSNALNLFTVVGGGGSPSF